MSSLPGPGQSGAPSPGPPITLQVGRYLAAVAVALVILVLAAIVLVVVLRGIDTSAPSLVGLFGFIATLVGLLVSLLRGESVATAVTGMRSTLGDVQEKVNGHLQAHAGSDEQVNALIDRRLAELGSQPPPPPAPPGEQAP